MNRKLQPRLEPNGFFFILLVMSRARCPCATADMMKGANCKYVVSHAFQGELMTVYTALPYVHRRKVLTVSLPNTANLSFNYYYVLIVIMLSYIPRKFVVILSSFKMYPPT